MCKIRLEHLVQCVLTLKAMLMVTNVQSNANYTPVTVIKLEEPASTHLADQSTGGLAVSPMRLSRRQSIINGIGESDVAHIVPINENGRYVGTYSPRCHETLVMSSTRAPKILELEPDIVKHGNHICHWEIIGADYCVPQINCNNFSLMEPALPDEPGSSLSPVCADEFLEVFDGSIGKSKYCGREGPQNLISGRYLRDLYITLKLASGNEKDRMFECSVSCHHPVDDMVGDDDPGNQLPELDDEPKVSTSCWCGRTDIHDVDGEVRKSEFPWAAALVTVDTRKPFCSGTLINDAFILTAAHCFRGQHRNISNFEVIINAHTLNITKIPFVKKRADVTKYLLSHDKLTARDKVDGSYRYKVQKYYLHPLFSRENRDFDVALVKLEDTVDFKTMKDVIPICLPDPGQYEHNKDGTRAVITGWGFDSYVNKTMRIYADHVNKFRVLEKQWVDVYPHEDCIKLFRWKYTHRMMCAGHNQNETFTHESQVEVLSKRKAKDKERNVTICSADSGSPLISFRSKTIYEQIGILAYPNAEGCERNKTGPAVFIDTRQISNWINYVTTTEQAVWCSA